MTGKKAGAASAAVLPKSSRYKISIARPCMPDNADSAPLSALKVELVDILSVPDLAPRVLLIAQEMLQVITAHCC